ncbi:MAG: RNA polymerase sigma factor [Bdellovibrionota bacterium]
MSEKDDAIKASTHKEQGDEELMLAYQNGDEKAFGLLYQRYSGRVYGYLSRRLKGDRELTDDLFQATFLKFHKSRFQYDASFKFAPWIFIICKSVLVDGVRKRGRILEDADSLHIDAAVDSASQEASSAAPLSIVAAEGRIPAFGSLSAMQKTVLELRFNEDLSFDEIARKLDTSPINARQIVSRAVRRLRALMGGSHETP